MFAQGFVTAQDRLWQMDTNRRYAAGNLAEILGPGMLRHDRRQRYLQIRTAAEKGAAALSAEDRKMLEAYARGVNAFITPSHDRLPLEFKLLHYSPAPWTIVDSLLIGANMDQMLNTQYDLELKREKVISHLNAQEIADIFPATSWRDLPPGQQAKVLEDRPRRRKSDSQEDDDEEGGQAPANNSALLADSERRCEMCVPGSNNWAISGLHTASGRPMLSNDMHLDHSIPNIWYEAHLTKGNGSDFDVAGVSLPGLPFVIVGHNRRIAWGFTNLGPDVQDLFVEQFNVSGDALTPDGYRTPQKVHEIVHVKGAPDEQFDVLVTRHGPIITPILRGETRQLALQWTLYDPQIMGIPFLAVNSARNWAEFRQALSQFGGPAQNVAYADVDGHIGYQATGRIPIRSSGDGLAPQSGADAAHDWAGYVPFEQLPSVYDPPSGMVATANGRITPDQYPHLLANVWWAPYRTARIVQLLNEGSGCKPADMLAIQTDITSQLERFFADRFVYAIDHAKTSTPRVRNAAEIMRGWAGQMSADSAAPTIARRSRLKLSELLLKPKLGGDYEIYDWGLSQPALEDIVSHRLQRWLPAGHASYDDVLTAAVQKTVESPDAPKELKDWKWGKQYPIEIQHPVLGQMPMLRWFSGTGKHSQSGSGSTVKQVGAGFGPSERMTVDFSNLDHSTLNIVVGQSGHLLSPHYKDQFAAWYGNTTFLLPFSDTAVNAAAEHTLTLQPR
jgi:penicillin amidase